MLSSKYGSVLTIILIVVIVAIVAIIGYFGFDIITQKSQEKASASVVEQFDTAHPTIAAVDDENTMSDPNSMSAGGTIEDVNANNTSGGNGSGSGSESSSKKKKVMMNGYEVIGTIRIPATKLSQPILAKVTKKSLETAVVLLYTTAGINEPGNTVIIGHNYRNSKFFSKNDKLKKGDTIYVKNEAGVEVKYKITKIFEAKSSDASFYKADGSGKRMITLSTCTDDASKTDKRLIIQAEEAK